MASTDFRPVCTGWDTDLRQITPGATFSIGSDSLALIGPFAVDRLTEGVHNTTKQFRTNRNFKNSTRTFDGIAFGNAFVFTQNHGADGVAFEVHGEAENVAGKFQHFALHGIGKAVDTADTVGH
jgi:hypothetical protein